MSLVASRWAWEQDADSAAKLLLLALADHADDEGRCWPSVGRLVARTGASPRTVQRKLVELIEAGLVTRSAPPGKLPVYLLHCSTPASVTGVSDATSHIDPRQPDTPVSLTPPSQRHPTPVTLAGDPRQDGTPTPATVTPEPKEERIYSPSLRSDDVRDLNNPDATTAEPTVTRRAAKGSSEPAGFAEFWLAYPNKVARPKALQAYAKAVKRGADPAEVLAGLRRFQWPEDAQFIPHPATWLNNDRWQEMPARNRAAPQRQPGKSYAGCL